MNSCEEPPITRSRRKGEFKKLASPQMTKTGRATGRYKTRGKAKSFNNQTNPGAGTFTVYCIQYRIFLSILLLRASRIKMGASLPRRFHITIDQKRPY